LILDEATGALDSENERTIRAALRALRGRTTILVIAHRLSTAVEADQVVVLDSGRVVETGSFSELSELRTGRLQALIEAGATGPVALS
jgi:ABC-type multidrug transport system fused ATPase/permease subunit